MSMIESIRMAARRTGEPNKNGVGAAPISGILRDRYYRTPTAASSMRLRPRRFAE